MTRSRRELLTNHNRCWIWGRNVVLETLRAAYWPVIELLHSDRCDPQSRTEATQLAQRLGLKIEAVRDEDLEKSCRSDNHQGLAARMPPFPYSDLNPLLDRLAKNPVLVMLDRVQDSHNFGAIIRSADVLGIDGVIVGTREQAIVNSLVARSSAGSVNYVPIAQVEDLWSCARSLIERGYQIVGTSDHAPEIIWEPDYRQPTVLLIGNEGSGLHPALEAVCNKYVHIPMSGRVNSLNAAVSAGIFFYEVTRQRRISH